MQGFCWRMELVCRVQIQVKAVSVQKVLDEQTI